MKTFYRRNFTAIILSISFLDAYGFQHLLDNTFGDYGKITAAFGSADNQCNALAIQPDGKIISGGYSWDGSMSAFALMRFTSDGSPDDSFGDNGKVTTQVGTYDDIRSIALQSDGRIIAFGYSDDGENMDFALTRYLLDGNLDETFGKGGKVTTDVSMVDYPWSVLIQPDGKIIAAGYTHSATTAQDFLLIRHLSNGEIDKSFGDDGIVITDFEGRPDVLNKILLQPDGKIVAIGSASTERGYIFGITRYDSDGFLDTTFGKEGKVTGYYQNTIHNILLTGALQPDGKIIAGGWLCNNPTRFDQAFADMVLVRYNADGSLDTSFAGTGMRVVDIGDADNCHAIEIFDAGQIVAAGNTGSRPDSKHAIIRLNNNGTLDESFADKGKLITDFSGGDDVLTEMMLQSDGRIVTAGYSISQSQKNFTLARYVHTTVMDVEENFFSGNILISPNPVVDKITLEYSLTAETTVVVTLFDGVGRSVVLAEERQTVGNHVKELRLTEVVQRGVYFLQLKAGNTIVTSRIIIL